MSDSRASSSASGFGCFGMVLSATLSLALNKSIGWALFHLFCGWFYVLYIIFTRATEVIPALRALFGMSA